SLVRALILVAISVLLAACGVARQSGGGAGSGGGGGGGGGVSPDGSPDGSIEGAGGGGTAADAGAPLACPVVNGIDGVGVCGAWKLSSWDANCSDGYTRVRSCDPGYDCRVSDHNGCAAGVNVGESAPAGCAQCPGGGGGGGGG